MQRLPLTLLVATLGCALAATFTPAAGTPAPAGGTTAAIVPMTPETPGRIAFTDDVDHLQVAHLDREANGVVTADTSNRDSFDLGVFMYQQGPDHEAEASTDTQGGSTSVAFVSTTDSPQGEVYLQQGGVTMRITCDPPDAGRVETHPASTLASGDLPAVAYATRRGGDWDIWVATWQPNNPPGEDGCAGIDYQQVTGADPQDPGGASSDETWPAWNADGSVLVFSSNRTDPLGDLFAAPYTPGQGNDWGAPRRLTDSPAGETQPSIGELTNGVCSDPDGCVPQAADCQGGFDVETWIAFTHTGRGTNDALPGGNRLGFLRLDLANPGADPVLTDVEGSEPAWSGCANFPYLAYTSRVDDPYGDVHVAPVDLPTPTSDQPGLDGRRDEAAALPGVAESHPAWQTAFSTTPPVINLTGGEPTLDNALLIFTSRTVRRDQIEGESRLTDADITDVAATNGSDRTVRVRAQLGTGDEDLRFDEAGPDWSPDGNRLAFSRDLTEVVQVDGEDNPVHGRELMLARADGSNARSLATMTGRQEGDFDSDPAWSRDGTRIAFTRSHTVVNSDGTFHGPPQVWVVDLESERAFEVAVESTATRAELDPDWSPDGQFLVVAALPAFNPEFARRAGPTSAAGTGLWVLQARADGSAAPVQFVFPCQFSDCGFVPGFECSGEDPAFCGPIPGRSPTWSPDGSSIAYTDGDALRLLAGLTGPEPADFADTEDPGRPGWNLSADQFRVLVGFRDGGNGSPSPTDNEGSPTTARARISDADDPAWSPDGTEIAFAGTPAGQPDQRDIWAIAPDGTGLRQVTRDRGPDTEPTWKDLRRDSADIAVTLSATPKVLPGDPVTVTATVTNTGPDPASGVQLAMTFGAFDSLLAPAPRPLGCRADGGGCTVPSLPPGGSFSYVVELTWDEPGAAAVATARVSSSTADPDLTNNEATTTYTTDPDIPLEVQVALDEPVGYVGGTRTATYTVTNKAFIGAGRPAEADPITEAYSARDVTLSVRYPALLEPEDPAADPLPCQAEADVCDLGDIPPGESQSVTVELDLPRDGNGAIVATAATTSFQSSEEGNRGRARLEVLQPTIRLLPSVARPGQVVLAYGEDMPPGTDVELEWERGITVTTGPFAVKPDGTLRAPLLIIRHDQLQARVLTATSTTDEFSPVTGELLVVPRPAQAPEMLSRG